ncbi:hypothetical protein AVEN_215948-1, partial [Araneus ventricosus]
DRDSVPVDTLFCVRAGTADVALNEYDLFLGI